MNLEPQRLDPNTSALILIDLQKGIATGARQPRSAEDTVAAAKTLAGRFRAAGAPVFLVRVAWAKDLSDMPSRKVDQAMPLPDGGLPADWSDYVDGLEQPGDIRIIKRQWGAFTGTALDSLLRRRRVTTVVIGGIATNFGVESTARFAWELGYDVVIAEDACTTTTSELHDVSIRHILPRIARVMTSGDIVL